MPKRKTTRKYLEPERRHDKLTDIRAGNEKMWAAWELGRHLIDQLGMHASYGAMKEFAGGDESTAERYRKLRSTANRITQDELSTIFELCELHGKAWGPTYLVALGRLSTVRERRQMARDAIQAGWGLAEFQRRVRRKLGTEKDGARVGRKRQLDLMDEGEILEEVSRHCEGWIRLAALLQSDDADVLGKVGLELLPKKLREQFMEIAVMVIELQQRTEWRLDRVRG
jgi:hypothetical protein